MKKVIIFILIIILLLLYPLHVQKNTLIPVSGKDHCGNVSSNIQPPKQIPFFPNKPPNDPLYNIQWNLDNQGEEYKGIGNTKIISKFGIQTEKAWKAGASGEGVKIAILSSGVAYENWTDPVSGNAYKKAPDFTNTAFDTENARDFTVDSSLEKHLHANDDWGVGTEITNIIAANIDNEIEFAGIAYKATILPIKVYYRVGSSYGFTTNKDLMIKGIKWAADHGADIICTSYATNKDSDDLHEAIRYATNLGVSVVANPFWTTKLNKSGVEPGTLVYPAAYTECIAAGGSNFTGYPPDKVNYGKFITVYAPHGNFTTADMNQDGYRDGIHSVTFYPIIQNEDGTYSYSFNQDFAMRYLGNTDPINAQVSAVTAFIIQKHPDWTPAKVKETLIKSARNIGKDPLGNNMLLVDAYAAFTYGD